MQSGPVELEYDDNYPKEAEDPSGSQRIDCAKERQHSLLDSGRRLHAQHS